MQNFLEVAIIRYQNSHRNENIMPLDEEEVVDGNGEEEEEEILVNPDDVVPMQGKYFICLKNCR